MSGLPAAAIFAVRYAPATCTSASARLARAGCPGSCRRRLPRRTWAFRGNAAAGGPLSSAVSPCGRCGCSQSPAAARSACSTTAPSAAGSLALIVIDPSSPTWTLTRRSAQLASSSVSDALRCAATNRSHCAAVIGPAISARSASVAVVAIRVSARTLAYDSCRFSHAVSRSSAMVRRGRELLSSPGCPRKPRSRLLTGSVAISRAARAGWRWPIWVRFWMSTPYSSIGTGEPSTCPAKTHSRAGWLRQLPTLCRRGGVCVLH